MCRGPRRRALLVIALLATTIVGASGVQLGLSSAALSAYRDTVTERLLAGDDCVGAGAMVSACVDDHTLPADVATAPLAGDIGIVEGGTPYLEGCAYSLVGSDFLSRHCVWERPDSARTVVIVGDSHAAQWADPIRRIADERSWRVEVYFRGGCLPADRGDEIDGTMFGRTCQAWSRSVSDQLAERDDVDVVLFGARMSRYVSERAAADPSLDASEATDDVVGSVSRYIAGWRESVGSVVILQDTPDPGTDVPVCLDEARAAGEGPALADPCAVATAPEDTGVEPWDASPLDDEVSGRVADAVRIPLLVMTDLFCSDRTCHTVIGGVPVYRDDNHMTRSFASTTADQLARRIDRALGSH